MAEKKNKLCVEINLLPAEYRKVKNDLSWILDRRIVWPIVALLVVAVLIFLLILHIEDVTSSLENELQTTLAEVEKEKPLLNKITELDNKLSVIAQKNNALK